MSRSVSVLPQYGKEETIIAIWMWQQLPATGAFYSPIGLNSFMLCIRLM